MAPALSMLSSCDAVVCCVGCLSLVPGFVSKVVTRFAFLPPRPPGYHVTEDNRVFLIESDHGLREMPDLTHEGIAVTAVRMRTRRGNDIVGFHFRLQDSSRRTLLVSHGNSTDIGIIFHKLTDLCSKLEVDVFAYEYSGYGESSGAPSEEDVCADIEAAYLYLTGECRISGEHIICYGQSIGSVPTVDLAVSCNVGGVVLHSALKSGLSVLHNVKGTYWFDVFQNAKKIRRVRAPVFVLHGVQDAFIPLDHGRTLYEACPVGMAFDPWWVQEAGHNDIESRHREAYYEHLARFLEALDSAERDWAGASRSEGDDESDGDGGGSERDAFRPLIPPRRTKL